ncbi:MAG: GNAT family N-acetyltransferase [Gammaproteobacteria bacterium]|nr:GNAT family N-acetyltransferase [Gammaproteobacteria bacterium]
MHITKVTSDKQLDVIVALANTIWHEHFTPIIGSAQVEYMLDKFQSKNSISKQIDNGFTYFLLIKNERPIGYVGIITKEGQLFLSKFYILSTERSHGFGKQVLQFLEALARKNKLESICLTVNKHNSDAIQAYLKMDFVNLGSIVQDIGGGFIMDDYKMEKSIRL